MINRNATLDAAYDTAYAAFKIADNNQTVARDAVEATHVIFAADRSSVVARGNWVAARETRAVAEAACEVADDARASALSAASSAFVANTEKARAAYRVANPIEVPYCNNDTSANDIDVRQNSYGFFTESQY